VSCKGCKRECPTGVDMAKMKVEFLYHYRQRHGMTLKDRVVAYLPRYAPLASRFSFLVNPLQNTFKGHIGFSPQRSLPPWHSSPFNETSQEPHPPPGPPPEREGENGRRVALMVDTFNRYFEPENARAALAVLKA